MKPRAAERTPQSEMPDTTRGSPSGQRYWARFSVVVALMIACPVVVRGCDGNVEAGMTPGALAAIRSMLFERVVPKEGPPIAFTMAYDVDITAQEFLDHYAWPLWNLRENDEVVLTRSRMGTSGLMHRTYVQFHAGFPVVGGRVHLDTRRGRLRYGGGDFVGGLKLELKPQITEDDARLLAHQAVAEAICPQPWLAFYHAPAGELLITDRRLAWRFRMLSYYPLVAQIVDVDAVDGTILANWSAMMHVQQAKHGAES